LIDDVRYPNAAQIVASAVNRWPSHASFLRQSFAGRDADLMRSVERHAAIVRNVIGSESSLFRFCDDYRYLCQKLLEEELYFRRNGRYRLGSFSEAVAEVYSDKIFMDRYMNFLLLSYILWDNHSRAIAHFENSYLPSLPSGVRHLEIGPGHGLLLHLAMTRGSIANFTAWDVSETSVMQTRRCLSAMGSRCEVELVLQNLFHPPSPKEKQSLFGSVVMSEILEHLENPAEALAAVSKHMQPGARLWVNIPVNSPAPDHLYLLREPEQALELVRAGGFEVIDHAFFPMTGQSLEHARRHNLTISVVLTAQLS
jgi:2-polyprenyl-3-methyl-5-hydroxy-6-metoxy-1,4-benzoquinol methylase